jgi:hypothetical protein
MTVRRAALTVCSLATLTTLLAGCGGNDESAAAPAEEHSSTAVSGPTGTASSSAPATDCSPPTKDVEYRGGSASFDVTAGPDEGHYDLTLDTSGSNGYSAEDNEITGNWLSEDEKAVLFIDIEGGDPCTPDAFVSIGTQGTSGPVFIDSSHTGCTVELPSFGDAVAEGTFSCTGLTGGGEGLERDVSGTFTLTP